MLTLFMKMNDAAQSLISNQMLVSSVFSCKHCSACVYL